MSEDDIRKFANVLEELRRQRKISEEVYETLMEGVKGLKEAKKLLTEDIGGSTYASKLVSLGLALLATPVPVASEAAGLGLIAAGLLLKKAGKKDLQLAFLSREFESEVEEIKRALEEIKASMPRLEDD